MKRSPIIFAIAGFLAACATVEPVEVADVTPVCVNATHVDADIESARGNPTIQLEHLTGAAARAFIIRTGGGNVSYLSSVEHVVYARGVTPVGVLARAYGADGCNLVEVILPPEVVFGRGA